MAGERTPEALAQELEATLESIRDGFFSVDSEWRFVYVNSIAEQVLGIRREEVLGRSHWDVFPLTIGTELEHQYRRAASGETVDFKNYYEPWGRWFHNRCFPRAGGGMSVYFQDITEDERTEDALRRSEMRYRVLHDGIRDGLVQAGMDGHIIEANPAYRELLGYSNEELAALTYQELTPEKWHAEEERIVREQILARGYSDVYEKEYRRKDGSLVPVELRTILMRDDNGAPESMWAIVRDITGRKAAEKLLRESLERAEVIARREETLRLVAQAAASSLTPTKLAARITDLVARLFGAKHTQIRLLDESETILESAGTHDLDGFLQRATEMPVDADTETAACFRSGKPRIAETIPDSLTEESKRNVAQAGIQSYVLQPILANNQPVGVFYMAWEEPRRFSAEDVSFIEAVTTQFSVGLQNARLFESQRRRRHRIEALHGLMQVAVSSLDVSSSGQEILDYLVGHYSFDLASLWLARGDELQLIAQAGYPESYADLSPLSLSSPFDAARVFNTGKLIVTREPTNPAVLRAYDDMDIRLGSYIVLPLSSRGRNIGILALVWHEQQELNRHDINFYESIAGEIAVVLENAMLYKTEHTIAETLQETLVVLPKELPEVAFSRAYESATFESGRVGGDFVDVFEVGTHLVGITLGDVSGKGIDAAVTTSMIRTTLRVHALDGLCAAEVAAKANAVMRRFTKADSFVTLWFGLLDTRSGKLCYVCAGHPPALLLSQSGETRELDCDDPILGAFDDVSFDGAETTVVLGDRILLYSDGVTEARSPRGEFLNTVGLLDLVARHRAVPTAELASAIMPEVVGFSDGVLRDDAAILVVEPVAVEG